MMQNNELKLLSKSEAEGQLALSPHTIRLSYKLSLRLEQSLRVQICRFSGPLTN